MTRKATAISDREQLQHIPYVGGPRRISKYRRLQILGGQTVTDRDTEQGDDLLGMRPNEVSAQDPIGVLFDQCLETVDQFFESQGGVPVKYATNPRSAIAVLTAGLKCAPLIWPSA